MEFELEVTVKATRKIEGAKTSEVSTYSITKENIHDDDLYDLRQHLEDQLVTKYI